MEVHWGVIEKNYLSHRMIVFLSNSTLSCLWCLLPKKIFEANSRENVKINAVKEDNYLWQFVIIPK